MDNEVPLPPPRRIRHRSPATRSHATTTTTTGSSLKKTYRLSRFDDRSSQPSSDPALFSSDDIPASGLENYNGPVASAAGRKRRYRGTWWGETVVDPKRKRADFKDKRLVDSGVWMGSDESFAESLLPSKDALAWGEELAKNMKGSTATATILGNDVQSAVGDSNAGAWGSQHATVQQRGGAFRKVEEPREHQLARTIIHDCLEKGQDSVDLSGGVLRMIPPGLLLPLQHLTKLPSIIEPPISEEGYSALHPFLRLFLAGNALTAVSGELFELKCLRVLSLRNNKLTEIPPAIRRLTMLQEVNLSVNRLQCLPWELLWLIKKGDLKHLIVQPNPLLQINEVEVANWYTLDGSDTSSPEEALKSCDYEGPAPEEAWAPIHVATGPVRRFNMEGIPIADGQPGSIPMLSPDRASSRVPSLREVSLLAFSQSAYFDQISDSEMADYPELMLRLLRQARGVRNAGGRSCSICHRSFVISRTEWIEWWDCSTYENGLKGPRGSGEQLRPLPFRRVGCSWACVPEAARTAAQAQGELSSS
ncbi:leucine-rich repeat domain-containing protein [Aspergillus clavatus NRRL 1]|uniref:Leucine Rich Repeat domain protein n=1 Tax=Aspergillus clavatus (strain ATCC 1007 / CBS 513.65 / DSM 816 / NCTC 3887 / NRRL 1 / QM 1276 / 107) TaxID=344612 RepID=A1CF89_ASPCL|nr:Leucine Rich Repeat domain protein [Aspergillus clavatus NRRL 1]EAW11538.1 Leucine Rich Repeat domain protein [Aspergillus clavatus NRRL 1]